MRFVKQDFLALLALLLLVLLFFWPVTFNLGWIPRGGGDLVSLLWPNYSYAAQSLRAYRLPLWNHTLFSGIPFAADNQTSLFYPFNLLVFFLVPSLPYEAVEWLAVFHLWLAGASMYFLMRVLLPSPLLPSRPAPKALDWGGPYLPSLFSAIAFMFSDVFITHIGNLNLNAVSAWLPAVFAALYLSLERRSLGWAAGAGVLLGLSTLAGHAQMTFIIVIGLGVYAAWRLMSEIKSAPRALAHDLGLVIFMFAIAVGVSAITVVPSLEMAQHTDRTRFTYEAASSYSIPWAGLAGLFTPLVFGRGPVDFWGPWDRVELGYLGVLPLFFAGLAPFRDRRSMPAFMGLLAVFGLLVALGANFPLHRLLYSTIPGFAQMRVPSRYILLADFSLAVLGGFGVYYLADVSRRRLGLWSVILSVIAVTTIVFGYRSAVGAAGAPHASALRWAMAVTVGLLTSGLALVAWRDKLSRAAPMLAVVIVSLDLVGHGAWVEVDDADPTLGFQHPVAAAFLRAQPGPTRIDNAAGAWSPSAAARYGLEDVNGTNHALLLARYQAYYWSVGARGTPLYNFLNAQFVVADKDRPPADNTFVPVYNEDPGVDIYLNTNAMPRVSLVYSATAVSTAEAAFAAIHAPGFDPASAVVVEGLGAPAPAAGPAQGESNLYYLDYKPESFSVIAVNPAPAYLVFGEVWYPGWRAWVDGVEVPIFRANFAFRGLYLPTPGEHTVVMKFDPLSWKIGLGLTLLTWAGLAAWLAYWFYRRRTLRLAAARV